MKKKLKKSLSQVFLIDKKIKEKIIKIIKIRKKDVIIEVGPGNGAISDYLIKLSDNVILIELDNILFDNLKKKINNNNVKIYNDDILKFDFKGIFKKFKKVRLIGNIPYKISSQILFKLIDIKKNLLDINFVVQKELAEKLLKGKNNALSLIVGYYFVTSKFFDIKPCSFYPMPKVKSSFIKLLPYKNKKIILKHKIFKYIVKNLLSKRRKFILNFHKGLIIYSKYIDLYKRSSDMNLYEYIRISNLFFINRLED